MKYYYAIIERSYNFCVLETGYGESDKAWERANKLQAECSLIKDIDVLLFNTEKERLQHLVDSTR